VRQQLHQSGVEMLGRCGIQFENRFIKGMKRRPRSYLIAGQATDRAVNFDLERKIQTSELAEEDVICDLARDTVETYPNKEEIELDDDEQGQSVEAVLGETKDKAVRLVKAHHRNIAPVIQPFQTARKFSVNMDKFLRQRATELHQQAEAAGMENRAYARVLHEQARLLNVAARDGLDFVGEQDIVEKIGTSYMAIRDTKTSKKSPSDHMAHDSHQLTAYSLASVVVDGKLPNALKLDYLVDLKRETKTVTLTSGRDMKDVENYLNRIVAAVQSIRSGIFVPAPNTAWWCSDKYCGYHATCPFVRNKAQFLPPENLSGKAGKLVEIQPVVDGE